MRHYGGSVASLTRQWNYYVSCLAGFMSEWNPTLTLPDHTGSGGLVSARPVLGGPVSGGLAQMAKMRPGGVH